MQWGHSDAGKRPLSAARLECLALSATVRVRGIRVRETSGPRRAKSPRGGSRSGGTVETIGTALVNVKTTAFARLLRIHLAVAYRQAASRKTIVAADAGDLLASQLDQPSCLTSATGPAQSCEPRSRLHGSAVVTKRIQVERFGARHLALWQPHAGSALIYPVADVEPRNGLLWGTFPAGYPRVDFFIPAGDDSHDGWTHRACPTSVGGSVQRQANNKEAPWLPLPAAGAVGPTTAKSHGP